MVSHLVCTLDLKIWLKKKAISRTAIIPVFPFKNNSGVWIFLTEKNPQLKFINGSLIPDE